MESSVFMKVMLVIIIIIQIVATVFAIRLVRRTKYNSIWFLCIVGFIALSVVRNLSFWALSRISRRAEEGSPL